MENELEKFFVDLENHEVTEMYYNPDAFAGGQYVTIKYYFENIFKADELYPNNSKEDILSFFEYLECKYPQYLADVGTESFEPAEEQYYKKADFVGCTQTTKEQLTKIAIKEINREWREKREQMEEQRRYGVSTKNGIPVYFIKFDNEEDALKWLNTEEYDFRIRELFNSVDELYEAYKDCFEENFGVEDLEEEMRDYTEIQKKKAMDDFDLDEPEFERW